MPTRSDVRAVFFDIGNTLIYPYPSVSEVCLEVLEDAGHTRDLKEIDDLLPLVDEYYEDKYREDDTFWTNEQATSEVWLGMYTLLCERLGIREEASVLARRVYDEFGHSSRWRAYDDVAPALSRLHAVGGLKLGVISNWDLRLESLLEGLGMAPSFDTVVSSAAVGLHKPDPRIFKLACRQMGVEPAEAVHVGDHHYADVLGARSVGMGTVLIDRTGNGFMDADVSTLDELESFLGWD